MIPALRYRVITDLHSRKPSVQAPNLTSLTLTSLKNEPPNPKIKLWTLVRLNTEFELQIHLNPPKISWINYLATGSDPTALVGCSSDASWLYPSPSFGHLLLTMNARKIMQLHTYFQYHLSTTIHPLLYPPHLRKRGILAETIAYSSSSSINVCTNFLNSIKEVMAM